MKIGIEASGRRVMVLIALVGAAGCGGADRNVLPPNPNAQEPSPAREASELPAGTEEGPQDSGGGDRVDDASREGSGREPVPCGNLTCGADEYCEIKCTCCGTRVPDPSEASASYSCLPLPPECATTSDGLCGGNRTQEVPCA